MSSTHRHLLLDFFWQVISGPPCIVNIFIFIINFSDLLIVIVTFCPDLDKIVTEKRSSNI
jgi:hypothetical protein